jgi:hypothetical protein
LAALVLGAGAVAIGAQGGVQALATQQHGAVTHNGGNPNAIPPILAPANGSELKAIRAAEAWEAQKSYYDPPASAVYDSSVFDVFGTGGQGGS